jgi:fused signal recognition particle receptor
MKKIFKGINIIWQKFKKTDDRFWDELEEELITSDVSISTTGKIISDMKKKSYRENINDPEGLRKLLKEEIMGILGTGARKELKYSDKPPTVYMVVGVNGTGKTSSIAKIANMFKQQGKRIIIAAADTFRAAAAEQLGHFAERLGIDMVRHQRNSDPGAVVYDSLDRAVARKADIVIIDTAGRMQTSYNLMEEIKKIKMVVRKKLGREPDEVLLTIDSTTGQNARNQAEIFAEAVDVSGIILTKVDSTSKGGIIITIKNDLGIPVRIITDGEGLDDIYYFDADSFADMMFS